MELVREWQASGLSKNMFCRAHGIACATVCTWRDKAASLPGNGNMIFVASLGYARIVMCLRVQNEQIQEIWRTRAKQ